jgi:hypothetical protein
MRADGFHCLLGSEELFDMTMAVRTNVRETKL